MTALDVINPATGGGARDKLGDLEKIRWQDPDLIQCLNAFLADVRRRVPELGLQDSGEMSGAWPRLTALSDTLPVPDDWHPYAVHFVCAGALENNMSAERDQQRAAYHRKQYESIFVPAAPGQ